MALALIIGNKNYSSWSLRPWLAMTVAGIAFEETVISLDAADFKATVRKYSPAGKVPILVDGDVRVWESTAILEYLAEKFPQAGLWPASPQVRAHARAIIAEMHAGFLPLRREYPMNFWRPAQPRACRAGGALLVRRLRRGGCDVRARRLALPHLCGGG